MSVTFKVGRGNRDGYVPCPTCGANSPEYGNPMCEETHPGSRYPCMGYGFTIEDRSLPELNVANTNARLILAELVGRPDLANGDLCGELDPATVLLALSVADPIRLLRPTRTHERVILSMEGVAVAEDVYFGVCEEQAARYLTVLRAIAQAAAASGEPITFD